MRLVLTILVLLMFNGCASVSYRSSENKEVPAGVYPGVRTDVQWIKASSRSYPAENYFLAGPFLDALKFIVIPVAIIDMPLSFVFDTLCLPADMRTSVGHESRKDNNEFN